MKTMTLVIFLLSYIGIIFSGLGKFNVDRPSAAFFGAVALIVFGMVPFPEAVAAIDFNTIGLLLGMMLLIAVLELDGFFSLIAHKALALSKTPGQLLAVIVFTTGIASAFLVNDAVVLLFTPVVIEICAAARLKCEPFLIAEILASNAGSVMTITGNPQNMLIGIASGISYADFMLYLAPVSVISMGIIIVAVRLLYRDDFKAAAPLVYYENSFGYNYASMKYSVPIFLMVIVLFFLSSRLALPIPVIALGGGALALVFGKIKPAGVIREADWVLLLFFASLFVLVHGFEKTGYLAALTGQATLTSSAADIFHLHWVSLVLSQVVSNVPFTIVMLPVLKSAGSDILWLSLASASTLAGNATIIGAMANLIVLESARSQGIEIGFFRFLRTGFVVTLATLAVSWGVLVVWAGMR